MVGSELAGFFKSDYPSLKDDSHEGRPRSVFISENMQNMVLKDNGDRLSRSPRYLIRQCKP